MKDNTVIVVDNANYKSDYAEDCPFKAIVEWKPGARGTILVKSLATGKEYELYDHQVLEAMDIKDIRKLIDLSKYGE